MEERGTGIKVKKQNKIKTFPLYPKLLQYGCMYNVHVHGATCIVYGCMYNAHVHGATSIVHGYIYD